MAEQIIVQNPDPILRKEAELIHDFDNGALRTLIADMKKTMAANDGWGLAAPQIGKSLALFVVADEIAAGGHTVFINPRILSQSKETEREEEGCLSFAGQYIDITRPSCVEIEAKDERGKTFTAKGGGILARAFLHETDHVHGILFIDHLHDI